MKDYGPETYGERIADIYDALYADFDPAAIPALSALARGGRALELGIGTGRIALPLQQTGVEVQGVDASEAMVARLRAKPGGEKIRVTMGDFADVPVEGQFDLIYIPFNTFFQLLTQETQIRCVANVAKHLGPQGVFLAEAFVPDLARYTGHQSVRTVSIDKDQVRLDVSEHNPVSQHITAQHIFMAAKGLQLYPVELRYVWPSELDLMARLAGLALKERWGDWRGGAFAVDSGKHISIYGRA